MAEEVESIRERASLMHEALSDLRAEQIDRRSLVIAIVAMIFLPLTFITGVYGMNVANLPYAQSPWAFDAIMGSLPDDHRRRAGLFPAQALVPVAFVVLGRDPASIVPRGSRPMRSPRHGPRIKSGATTGGAYPARTVFHASASSPSDAAASRNGALSWPTAALTIVRRAPA